MSDVKVSFMMKNVKVIEKGQLLGQQLSFVFKIP